MKDLMSTMCYADAECRPDAFDRLPNLNGMFNSHCLLSGRRRGVCDMLKGKVLVTFILVDDLGSLWRDIDVEKFERIQNNASLILENQAREYGTELSIDTRFIKCGIAVKADSAEHSWMYAALDTAGLSVENTTDELKNSGEYNEAPIIFALNKDGRGHADSRNNVNDIFEYAVIYGFNDYRHELLHLFGAVDFYLPEAVSDFADKHFHDSIMFDSSDVDDNEKCVDSFTAYLIGWTDKISTEAYAFIQDTACLTEEYLNAEHDKNAFTGYGTKSDSGYEYKGYFKNGVFHGYGYMIWYGKDGCTSDYSGFWSNGKRNGYGCMRFADGCVYQGEWRNDKWNGIGTCIFPRGDVCHGEFRNGKMDGKGVCFYPDGSIYNGEWAEYKKNGHGINRSASGDVYDGYWHNNMKHGDGAIILANGERYEGCWQNDKKNGFGTYYYPDGTKCEGIWRNDVYIGNFDERLA